MGCILTFNLIITLAKAYNAMKKKFNVLIATFWCFTYFTTYLG